MVAILKSVAILDLVSNTMKHIGKGYPHVKGVIYSRYAPIISIMSGSLSLISD